VRKPTGGRARFAGIPPLSDSPRSRGLELEVNVWIRVRGQGFRIWGQGFRIWGQGFRIRGKGFKLWEMRPRVKDSGYRI